MTSTDQKLANVNSRSLFEGSLDPPSTRRPDLKPPFARHKYGLTAKVCAVITFSLSPRLQDMSYVAHMPGFTTLPRILIPMVSSARMPPIMHYGWLVNADFLFD